MKNVMKEFKKGKLNGYFFCLCSNDKIYPVQISGKRNNSIFEIIDILGPVGFTECSSYTEIEIHTRFLEKIYNFSKKLMPHKLNKSLKTKKFFD